MLGVDPVGLRAGWRVAPVDVAGRDGLAADLGELLGQRGNYGAAGTTATRGCLPTLASVPAPQQPADGPAGARGDAHDRDDRGAGDSAAPTTMTYRN